MANTTAQLPRPGTIPPPRAANNPAPKEQTEAQVAEDIFGSGKLEDLVNSLVAKRMQEAEDQRKAEALARAPKIPKFVPPLAIFKCDQYPFITVPELDFSNGHDAARKLPTGRQMQFRVGVFAATTQNQVDQLDWMSQNPTHTGSGDVIGGLPAIYRDEGESIKQCPYCRASGESFVTTSDNRMSAHMASMHGAVPGMSADELLPDVPVEL